MTSPNNPSGPTPPPPGGPPPGGPPPGGPPPGGPPPGGAAPGGRDLTELWGWLGIVTGLCCCGLIGGVFGWLSIREARRRGKSPVLGYIAIGVSVLNLLFNIIEFAGGGHPLIRR